MTVSKLVSEAELADIVNRDRMTLRAWRRKGIITPVYSSGEGRNARFIYSLAEVRKSLIKHGKNLTNK